MGQPTASHRLSTPVAFIIFNRPDTTAQVFETIGQAQPPELFIIADGPRPNHPEDVDKCAAAREVVADIDWDCRVRRNYAQTNMGCKRRVSTGLDWVFATVREAIILEDDCLPSQSFFAYCQVLLQRYRTDERIMLISGYNAQGDWRIDDEDYFFSNFGGIWGWASWRRAWRYFSPDMQDLDLVLARRALRDLLGERVGRLREEQFRDVRKRQVDTWDYAWGLARHVNSGLATVPKKSLIENIGFGQDATHTTSSPRRQIKRQELDFPLKSNRLMVADAAYDALFHRRPSLTKRILGKLKRFFARMVLGE